MKIQSLSDLHLEHGGYIPDHHPGTDVIVLAGDLCLYTEGVVERFAEQWSSAAHPLRAEERRVLRNGDRRG